MNSNRIILILIFTVAVSLRLGLAFVNRDANDNHIEVINLIADKHIIPEKNDCWSCFQPKLYYLIASGVIELLHYHVASHRIIASQMLNVVFSFFSLLLIWKFIRKRALGSANQLLVFALFAFNPCLAAINIQGTNDTLVIFCGIATLYFADSFFNEPRKKYFVLLLLAVIAAGLSKASGLILFAIIFLVFILKLAAASERTQRNLFLNYFLIFSIGFSIIVPFAGGYYYNYKKYDSIALSTWKKDPPPFFFKDSPIGRPGIINMFQGWFTFRYFDMIRQPYITNGPDNYPMHRTSLWSQLYGRTMFLQFDQWPISWQTQRSWVIDAGRALIILGIFPLLLFLYGLLTGIAGFIKALTGELKQYLSNADNYLHLIATVAFLTSSVIYSYSYRDFSAMKSIYIFPGLISFTKLFADGVASVRTKKYFPVIALVFFLIIILSTVDITYLFYQQYHYPHKGG